MLDTQVYYTKLANKEPISEEELVSLLKELAHFKGATAYLASCQAATLESLPKSASKGARGRHVTICDAAAKMLIGNSSPIKYPANTDSVRERCLAAIAEYRRD